MFICYFVVATVKLSHGTRVIYCPSLTHAIGDKDGNKVTTVLATVGKPPDRQQEINYCDVKIIGNGSFGVVYQARLLESNESVAIKKVLQDKRFKNRELQIMRRLDHCNIIRLQFFFYSSGDKVGVVSYVQWNL